MHFFRKGDVVLECMPFVLCRHHSMFKSREITFGLGQ